MHDVIVVGGSACGCIAACEAARAGAKVAIVEEDANFGKAGHCAGLLSLRCTKRLKVSSEAILNKINGVRAIADSVEFCISCSETKAIVVDRQALDEQLAANAINNGVSTHLGARASAISQKSQKSGSVSIRAGQRVLKTSVLIGADGINSFVARAVGFPPLEKIIYAWQATYEGLKIKNPHEVLLLFGSSWPGFFAWTIPINEEVARIGFGVSKIAAFRKAKEALMKAQPIKELGIETAKATTCFTAAIPIKPRRATQIGSILLVGDAAGQAKALSGGGLIFGSECARIAGRTAAEHVLNGSALNYEDEWRKSYQSTFKLHLLLRAILDALVSHQLIKPTLFTFSLLRINHLLNAMGDMDFIFKK